MYSKAADLIYLCDLRATSKVGLKIIFQAYSRKLTCQYANEVPTFNILSAKWRERERVDNLKNAKHQRPHVCEAKNFFPTLFSTSLATVNQAKWKSFTLFDKV